MKLDDKIIGEIERIVAALGAELYEAKYFFSGKTAVLRVFADTPSGITLDECSAISKKISLCLDEIDFSKGAYTLEVSSPGITRMLVSVRDFERVVGKELSVRYKNSDGNLRKKSGVLKASSEEKLIFESGEEIDFASVLNGKLTINL